MGTDEDDISNGVLSRLFEPDDDSALPGEIEERADGFIRGSKAANTRRAYRADWSDFAAWCAGYRRSPLPADPETVAGYLADRSRDLKPSTLGRRMATIAQAHRAAGLEPPTRYAKVRLVWAGILRERGMVQSHMRPALTEHIRAMVGHLPSSLLGIRDRALILLGYAGATRRSELVGLDVADLEEADEGIVVTIRRSKTDQAGIGRKVGIPYGDHPSTCPVAAVRAWLESSGISTGPLFRPVNRHGRVVPVRLSDRAVAEVVKRSLRPAGRPAGRYAGYSLRAGFITQAAMASVGEREIQDQSSHRSLAVLRRYIRDGSLFRENAASKVGL